MVQKEMRIYPLGIHPGSIFSCFIALITQIARAENNCCQSVITFFECMYSIMLLALRPSASPSRERLLLKSTSMPPRLLVSKKGTPLEHGACYLCGVLLLLF
ncbi:hypothetical protein ARMGADRAFT_1017977 [Armillaria gallica]|uniref:Uncharacterized protein n=1 Tax=Armillaria gallica TaxID=47427 RepID=A0A2H3D951_ARMGA|nr:hypothetical protein ARMGADRAFT_1017977 [Armillaria gallica]